MPRKKKSKLVRSNPLEVLQHPEVKAALANLQQTAEENLGRRARSVAGLLESAGLTRPPRIGIVEGFYWTEADAVAGRWGEYDARERMDLFAFMRSWSYTTYVYDPKCLRGPGREDPASLAPGSIWATTLSEAKRCGVEFIWGVAPERSEAFVPGLGRLLAFAERLVDLGAGIALLFDDVPGGATRLEAEQQAVLACEIERRFPGCVRGFCPGPYHGSSPHAPEIIPLLDAALPRETALFWTGREVWNAQIGPGDLPRLLSGRRVWLWDNWMASDTSAPHRLVLLPPQGRSQDLYHALDGYFLNPVFPLDRVVPVLAGAGIQIAHPGIDAAKARACMAETWAAWLVADGHGRYVDGLKSILLEGVSESGRKALSSRYKSIYSWMVSNDWDSSAGQDPAFTALQLLRNRPATSALGDFLAGFGPRPEASDQGIIVTPSGRTDHESDDETPVSRSPDLADPVQHEAAASCLRKLAGTLLVMCWQPGWRVHPLEKMTVKEREDHLEITNSTGIHWHAQVIHPRSLTASFEWILEVSGDIGEIRLQADSESDHFVNTLPGEVPGSDSARHLFRVHGHAAIPDEIAFEHFPAPRGRLDDAFREALRLSSRSEDLRERLGGRQLATRVFGLSRNGAVGLVPSISVPAGKTICIYEWTATGAASPIVSAS